MEITNYFGATIKLSSMLFNSLKRRTNFSAKEKCKLQDDLYRILLTFHRKKIENHLFLRKQSIVHQSSSR